MILGHRAAFSRWAAWGATAPAVYFGLRQIHESVLGQIDLIDLLRQHGLMFGRPACTTGYCDYTMFWLAGLLTRHGQAALLYDHARYTAAAAAVLPYASGYWPFVYPPVILLPATVISFAPLIAGYYGIGALFLALSVWLLRRSGIGWWCIAVGVLSPAALWNVYLGQLGLLCGSLLVAGLSAVESRPKRAGAMLAMLCIKPPYALLLPVVVLAGRRWRVMMAAAAVVTVLVIVSLLGAGAAAWAAYLGPGRAAMRGLLEQNFGPGYEAGGTSVFWMVRSLGAPLAPAFAAQAAMSAAAVLACWRLWARPAADPARRVTLTVLLTLLAGPYGFTYDLSVVSVLLAAQARRGAPWRNAALAWLWVAPGYVQRCSEHFGVLITPLLILTALVLTAGPPGAPLGWRRTIDATA